MRALVTGASGFIGPAIVAQLQDVGVAVRALVRPSSDTSRLRDQNVELAVGDVSDVRSLAQALKGVDLVVHSAGKTRARSLGELFAVNETGTANLARSCAACPNPPRLVLLSSLAAAGPGTADQPRVEADRCEPVSHYGRSKLAGELAARQFAGEVPISIVRPPMVCGGGDRDGFLLVRTIRKTGWQVVPRSGLPVSAIHVDDLAHGISLVASRGSILDTDDSGQGVYHLADPQPTSLSEIGHMIAVAVGKTIRTLRVRPWVFGTAAIINETASRLGCPPSIINRDKLREALAGGWVTATDKATTELGFRCKAPLAERYRQTVEWYHNNGWL